MGESYSTVTFKPQMRHTCVHACSTVLSPFSPFAIDNDLCIYYLLLSAPFRHPYLTIHPTYDNPQPTHRLLPFVLPTRQPCILRQQKCLVFEKMSTVWTAKQLVLDRLAQDLVDATNYGLYLPPASSETAHTALRRTRARSHGWAAVLSC